MTAQCDSADKVTTVREHSNEGRASEARDTPPSGNHLESQAGAAEAKEAAGRLGVESDALDSSQSMLSDSDRRVVLSTVCASNPPCCEHSNDASLVRIGAEEVGDPRFC